VILVVGTAVGIWWVSRYARRVHKDPSTSLIAADRAGEHRALQGRRRRRRRDGRLTRTQSSVLGAFFLAFVTMIVGVIPWSDLGASTGSRPTSGGSRR
jgi:uncharacterized ion transporter superfamily protein YfcC